MKKNEIKSYRSSLITREEGYVGPALDYRGYEECEDEKESMLWKFLKVLLIVAAIAFVILLLGILTHGRFFNFLLYLSLLGLSLSLAFFIPVFIADSIARLYCLIDRDPERKFWISATIRGLGLFEGGRNVVHSLHPHPMEPHKRRKYFY